MYMKSTTIFLILGVLLLVYLIHRNVINTSTSTTTKKSVTVVHHNSGLHPYYNPYKNQFYN